MNKTRLQTVFNNYIAKFAEMNAPAPGGDETYKWRIAYDFKEKMDAVLTGPEEDAPEKLKKLIGRTSNLLNNHWELPGAALSEYCAREAETVRSLLGDLFSDDGGDLNVRQQKINVFIAGCEVLRGRYFSGSVKFEIGQRAAMVLLGLYDPERNYMYKARQATDFADCMEFLEDWGTSRNFRLPVYYKMCDQLTEYIKAAPDLLAVHRGRYQNPPSPLHADRNLHLLAFDVIYCSTVYGLMDNISYTHVSVGERKQYLENRKTAEALAEQLAAEEAQLQLRGEAEAYFQSVLGVGAAVKHKLYGVGTVTDYTDDGNEHFVTVRFANGSEKKLKAEVSAVSGILSADAPDLPDRIAAYKAVINRSKQDLTNRIRKLENDLEFLREYL